MARFEIHSHSVYSNARLIDCINTVNDLVDRAIDNGLSGLCLTDHEILSGVPDLMTKADEIKEQYPDFKLAIGNEIYLTETREKSQKYFHFILIARDKTGYKMLKRLSTLAWLNMYSYKGMERVPTLKSELAYEIQKMGKGHLIASSSCFRKGTLVETKQGLKPIEEITSDDCVLSLQGKWEKVNFPTSRRYVGEGCKITFLENNTPTICTADHQFLVTTNNKIQNYLRTGLSDPLSWVAAKDLVLKKGSTKNICLYPMPQIEYSNNIILKKSEWKYSLRKNDYYTKISLPNEITITPELMQLFGLWLGDGSISINPQKNYYNIGFSFSGQEFDYYWENFFKEASDQLNIKWSTQKRNNKVELTSHSVELVELFYYLFGNNHAKTKTIPERLLHISQELDFNLFFGYALADGYFRTRQKDGYTIGEMCAASISKKLIDDFQNLLCSLGIRSSITTRLEHTPEDGTHHQESYYLSSSNRAWTLVNKKSFFSQSEVLKIFQAAKEHDLKKYVTINGVLYKKVYLKERTFFQMDEEVHCLNVPSHSFVCNKVIVHNCLGGELSTLAYELTQREEKDIPADEIKQKIHNFIQYCLDLFGEDFYIECAPGCSKQQLVVNKKLEQIAKAYNIKMVVATDAHFLTKEDRFIHKAYLNSKDGEREVDSFYEYSYLQTEDEIKENLELDYETLVKNSEEIYDKIERYSVWHSQQIPQVEVKDYPKKDELKEYPTLNYLYKSDNKHHRYWINQCVDRLKEKDLFNETYLSRLEEEADTKKVIGEKLDTNMFSYPILLQHYIDMFWECGSTVGAGRGSSCAGLNHYLLEVTQCDPIKENFPWFRYLNKERTEIGDIDLDLCPSKRPMILRKICEERGNNFNPDIEDIYRKNLGCALVATFGTEKSKSCVQTACFKQGTKVKTLNGEKNIEDITTDDFVLTSNGWEKVIAPTQLEWDKDYIKVDGNYSFGDSIICTNNHEFLVLPKEKGHQLSGSINNKIINNLIPEYKNFTENKKRKYRNYIRDVKPVWTQAKDLKEKDYLLMKIDNRIDDKTIIIWNNQTKTNVNKINKQIFINNKFCELIGIWIAEGSINRNQFSFTISSQEKELKERIIYLMEDVFGLKNPYINNRKNNSVVIQYTSADLRDFVYYIFKIKDYSELNQYNIYIPEILKYIEPQKQMQIFKGWIMGDGTYRERTEQQWSGSKEAKGTTVSRQLCLDMIHILHRNYLNPSIITEERENKAKVYTLIFSGAVAQRIGQIKYTNYNIDLTVDWDNRLGKDLPCIYNNELFMRCQVKSVETIFNKKSETVYCLMVPSQNFTVSGVIVHNCRGYRSKEYPQGIPVDESLYLSSLIPSERGFNWDLKDVIYGNEEKGRKPVHAFIRQIELYPGLKEIALKIEKLIKQRGVHASGVILFDEDPFEYCAFMRASSGEIITQFDLHSAEKMGMTKVDLLVTDVQDEITQTIKFLQKDNVIDSNLSLREVYNKYLHPDILPLKDKKLWDGLKNGSVFNIFQFNSVVGINGIRRLQPNNLDELTATNGLIRLMTGEKGAEQPIDKYYRFKHNPEDWIAEMHLCGLTLEEQEVFKKHLSATYGVGISQELMMLALMDPAICGFSLADANTARKIVGKKKMDKIPQLKEKIASSATSKAVGDYVWLAVVAPQLGYSFSEIHARVYSYIGVQTVYLGSYFNPAYWNTACLIVNSGSLEDNSTEEVVDIYEPEAEDLAEGVTFQDLPDQSGKIRKTASTDYNKVAKALGATIKAGISVSLVDINHSEFGFIPDAANNRILFGMKSLLGINDDIIKTIIDNRPYSSPRDFLQKVQPKKTQMVSLIKAGAFDSMLDRKECMAWYLWEICDKKSKLTLQNMPSLLNYNLIPKEYKLEKRIFEFNRYLKAITKADSARYEGMYTLDERAINFLHELGLDDIAETDNLAWFVKAKTWDKVYKKYMDNLRTCLNAETLEKLNKLIFLDEWNKYAQGNISAWEMEVMCFYYHEHELAHLDNQKYGINDYFKLPEEPEVDRVFTKGDKQIKLFKLVKIAGTAIAKDKNKGLLYLLTTSGVVTVKVSRELMSLYDRQISEIVDGKKEIIEKSWLTKGNRLIITGYRQGEQFISKTYKSSGGHHFYRINEVFDNGEIAIQVERAKNE